MDDPDDHVAVAIIRNDHIDFLNHEESQVEYEDDEDDDDDEEEDISHYADRDDDGAIGLSKQTAKR